MGIRWTGEDLESTRVGKGFLQAEADRQAPKVKKAAREHEESREQQAVIAWRNDNQRVIRDLDMLWAIPNGADVAPHHRNRLIAEGMTPGVPDLILPVPRGRYIGLAIEMKSKDGRIKDIQLHRLARLTDNGWLSLIARSADEAKKAIAAYLLDSRPKVIP